MQVRPPSVSAMHLTPEYAVPELLGEGSKVTTLAQTNREASDNSYKDYFFLNVASSEGSMLTIWRKVNSQISQKARTTKTPRGSCMIQVTPVLPLLN